MRVALLLRSELVRQPNVRLMFDHLHGDVAKHVSATNFTAAGAKFNAFAVRTQVAF